MRQRGYLILPLIVMVWLLFDGDTPTKAGIWSIALLCVLMVIFDANSHRRIIHVAFQAMTEAPRMIGPITVACAIAGIIVLTGLGLRLSGILIDFADGNLLLGLILTMVIAVVLGMGMPTSAAYIILATLLSPGLVEMGTSIVAAHLFIIYCASKSAITPPVAIASYAAAVAGTGPWQTSLTAFKPGLSVFIFPYMFVFGLELLGDGTPLAIGYALVAVLLTLIWLRVGNAMWTEPSRRSAKIGK